MNALINVVLPVFGIILTGYLAGRLEVLGRDSAAALNRFVFYFAVLFGGLIIFFLVVEPEGLNRLWRNIRNYFRVWPFSY